MRLYIALAFPAPRILRSTQGRTLHSWHLTAAAALSAMLSVTFTRRPVSTLTPTPAAGTAQTLLEQ